MAIPLLWLGAAAVTAYAGTKISKEWIKQDLIDKGHLGAYPGEGDASADFVDGAIVCCGIYEVFQHTGIVKDDVIVELKGNGLIRPVSPHRFLRERSGNRIYIACDEHGNVLADKVAAESAIDRIYQYQDYHVLDNNCHRFVAEVLLQRSYPITRFAELNTVLSEHFHTPIYWQPWSGH